jgi:4-oxalocrotonate tautomerase
VEEAAVPVVHIEMWEGRTVEQKQLLAREITEVLHRVTGCDPTTVRILIREYSPDNWAIGGSLQSDQRHHSTGAQTTLD